MWRRKVMIGAGGAIGVAAVLLVMVIASIRTGLQRYSDDAVAQFPGDRVEALMKVVECAECPLEDRNHAVWALGQMVEPRSLAVLKRHVDGRPCNHGSRLCQYELAKAIRMLERTDGTHRSVWRTVTQLHRPWR